jgi:hypothetical protein
MKKVLLGLLLTMSFFGYGQVVEFRLMKYLIESEKPEEDYSGRDPYKTCSLNSVFKLDLIKNTAEVKVIVGGKVLRSELYKVIPNPPTSEAKYNWTLIDYKDDVKCKLEISPNTEDNSLNTTESIEISDSWDKTTYVSIERISPVKKYSISQYWSEEPQVFNKDVDDERVLEYFEGGSDGDPGLYYGGDDYKGMPNCSEDSNLIINENSKTVTINLLDKNGRINGVKGSFVIQSKEYLDSGKCLYSLKSQNGKESILRLNYKTGFISLYTEDNCYRLVSRI